MRLTVLVDNNTLIDRYFQGEPGASYLIEDDGTKVLFDVGYSDMFLANARRMSIDLLDVDYVVLSHGHLDHTRGLAPLIRERSEAVIRGRSIKRPTLVAHPLVLASRSHPRLGEIGPLLSEDELSEHFDLELTTKPVHLTERLVFLGEIPRANAFEAKRPMGKLRIDGGEEDDFVIDDSSLVYGSAKGLVVITGCAHAGICNTVERAREVCGDDRIADIVGGLHLLSPPEEQLAGTIKYLEAVHPNAVHACHCTDLRSKIALSRAVALEEVGVGLTLEY